MCSVCRWPAGQPHSDQRISCKLVSNSIVDVAIIGNCPVDTLAHEVLQGPTALGARRGVCDYGGTARGWGGGEGHSSQFAARISLSGGACLCSNVFAVDSESCRECDARRSVDKGDKTGPPGEDTHHAMPQGRGWRGGCPDQGGRCPPHEEGPMQATHEEDPMASPAVQLLGELQLRAVAALRLDEAVAPEHDHGKKSKQWRSLIPYLILVELQSMHEIQVLFFIPLHLEPSTISVACGQTCCCTSMKFYCSV